MIVQVAVYIFLFIIGLLVGSFLNLVSDRINKKGKDGAILFGRSHCDFCKKDLQVFDLIPILSYAFSRGKCRYCSEKLSWYYPISEFLTGLGFVGLAYFSKLPLVFSVNPSGITPLPFIALTFLLSVFGIYVILFLTDAKEHIIPNRIVFPAIAYVLAFNVLLNAVILYNSYQKFQADGFGKFLFKVGIWHQQLYTTLQSFGLAILTAIIIAAFFIFLIYITKGRGMGWGDVNLGFLIGVFNGFPDGFLAIFLGFLFGAIYSVVLIVFRLKKMKDTIAFGPFLILGSITAYIWGAQILDWYISLFRR